MGPNPVKLLLTILICISLISQGTLHCQELLWEKTGAQDKERIGWSLATAGDVDRDGYEDILLGMSSWKAGTHGLQRILSGKDGSTLSQFHTTAPYLWPFVATGVGDMDGDGIVDFAVRIRDMSYRATPNKVEVRSGKTGKLLWSVQESWISEFGTAFIGDLDIDGDSKPDLVVASNRLRHPKHSTFILGGVWAFSNKGKLLYRLTGNLKGLKIGTSLAKIGDIDRDGKDDIVIGTNGYVPNGYGGAMVISGATGKTIFHAQDKTQKFMIGRGVSSAGDVDKDGIPDFVVSGSFGKPTMYVFSGKKGKILLKVQQAGQTDAVSGRGFDFDKDGIPDVVRNALGHRGVGASLGSVMVLSGRDGKVLVQADNVWRKGISSDFGAAVLALSPAPGSDIPRFAITQPDFGSSQTTGSTGRVAVYLGSPTAVRDFGEPCKGKRRVMNNPMIGIRRIGRATRVQLSKAPPGSTAILFLGLSKARFGTLRLPLNLNQFGFAGCSLYTSIDYLASSTAGKSGRNAGFASVDIPLPLTSTGKTSIHGQWAIMGPAAGQWGFSRGLVWKH